jgi:putative restriction endonuclease
MRMPFHALGSDRDRVWERLTEDGKPSISKETTSQCRIDDDLWQYLHAEDFRRESRQRLITSYFTPAEQISLCTRLNLSEPTTSEIAVIRSSTDEYRANQKKGRDVRFRSLVLLNYRFTCALTGYSLTTSNENMIEAAHIHQHSLSGNDDPRNGMALSPDAHWMFDRGLWTAMPSGGDFIVLVAKGQFAEFSGTSRTLLAHHEQPLTFPPTCTFKPDPKHLAWHRTHRFLG